MGLVVGIGTPRVTGNHIERGKTGISLGRSARPVMADNVVCGNEVNLIEVTDAVASMDGVTVCDTEASPAP